MVVTPQPPNSRLGPAHNSGNKTITAFSRLLKFV
jgi:hypothetical protein